MFDSCSKIFFHLSFQSYTSKYIFHAQKRKKNLKTFSKRIFKTSKAIFLYASCKGWLEEVCIEIQYMIFFIFLLEKKKLSVRMESLSYWINKWKQINSNVINYVTIFSIFFSFSYGIIYLFSSKEIDESYISIVFEPLYIISRKTSHYNYFKCPCKKKRYMYAFLGPFTQIHALKKRMRVTQLQLILTNFPW